MRGGSTAVCTIIPLKDCAVNCWSFRILLHSDLLNEQTLFHRKRKLNNEFSYFYWIHDIKQNHGAFWLNKHCFLLIINPPWTRSLSHLLRRRIKNSYTEPYKRRKERRTSPQSSVMTRSLPSQTLRAGMRYVNNDIAPSFSSNVTVSSQRFRAWPLILSGDYGLSLCVRWNHVFIAMVQSPPSPFITVW